MLLAWTIFQHLDQLNKNVPFKKSLIVGNVHFLLQLPYIKTITIDLSSHRGNGLMFHFIIFYGWLYFMRDTTIRSELNASVQYFKLNRPYLLRKRTLYVIVTPDTADRGHQAAKSDHYHYPDNFLISWCFLAPSQNLGDAKSWVCQQTMAVILLSGTYFYGYSRIQEHFPQELW